MIESCLVLYETQAVYGRRNIPMKNYYFIRHGYNISRIQLTAIDATATMAVRIFPVANPTIAQQMITNNRNDMMDTWKGIQRRFKC